MEEIKENLFNILGLEPSDEYTDEEIRKAWISRAKEIHPDKGGAAEDFQRVQKAYETLCNKTKRNEYYHTGEIKGKSDIDKKAKSTIMAMLDKVLNSTGEEIFLGDAPGAVLAYIDEEVETRKKMLTKLKKESQKYKRFGNRFKTKNEEDNDFIKQGFNAKIFDIRKEMKTKLEDLKVLKRMIKMLEDYEYIPEEGFTFKRWA